jgi:hypothetical protein
MRASDRNQQRDEDAIVGSLYTAFRSLKTRYLEVGGWLYPGDLGESRGYGFLGPWAWSEGDYQYQFARALEVEFPGSVHLEMPLKPAFRSGLELAPGSKGTRHIDIVVSDLASLPVDHAPAGRLFRERTHEAFVEVKRFMKGREEFRNINWRDFCKGVSGDAARLSEQKARGWCQVAALLIVDDRAWHVDRM